MLLLEGTSIGRVGRDVDWIRTLLLEGTLIGRVGPVVGWKGWIRRRLEGVGSDVDWKGMQLLDVDRMVRRLEGGAVAGR